MSEPEHERTTPEGHTPEGPRPGELGKPGTPGAGMTPAVPHPADADTAEQHGDTHTTSALPTDAAHVITHADAHSAETDHGHVEPHPGPIDWLTWAYAVVGAAVGVLVLALFFVAVA